MTNSIDDKLNEENKKDQQLTEKEFFLLLIDSEETFLSKIKELNANIAAYQALMNKALIYKSLGYNIKYYLSEAGMAYLDPYYNKPGFK